MKDCHISIFYSDEDGGYIADIPDLRYCSAFGETPDEALAESTQGQESLAQGRAYGEEADSQAGVSASHLPSGLGI